MPTATPPVRRLLARAGVMVIAAVGVSLFWRGDIERGYFRIFPRPFVLHAYAAGGPAEIARNVPRIFPPALQREHGLHMIVEPVPEGAVLDSPGAVLDAFRRSPAEPATSPLFVRLAPPFRTSKLAFRALIDAQTEFTGDARTRLLSRIVPLIGADEREPERGTPCTQFGDDVAYATWSFGGFALRVEEATFERLGPCLAEAIRIHATSDR